jgi:transposase
MKAASRVAKRDFVALEKRRMKAAQLLKQGHSQAAVARKLGVSREAVSRWNELMEDDGVTGLKRAGRAGRKPRLSDQQLASLTSALRNPPKTSGVDASAWTADNFAAFIKRRMRVTYHAGHAWKLMRRLSRTRR